MAQGRYLLHFKRRREGKTNYKKRLQLLLSQKTRLVIRITNNQVITHLVNYDAKGDRTVASVSSTALEKYGWKHSKKNTTASYLTGLLLARMAKEHKIKEALLDTGLMTVRAGTRLYAVVKGVIDGGINVPVGEGIFPTDDRIKGKHIESYRKTKIEDDFENTKKKIMSSKDKRIKK